MSLTSFKRRLLTAFWRLLNPLTLPFAGSAPWWVLVETIGRKSGATRRTPLAAGPREPGGMWLIAVHGHHAAWVRNIEANPRVRLKHRGSWREATATIKPMDPAVVRRFNPYARSGPIVAGLDPQLIRVDFAPNIS